MIAAQVLAAVRQGSF